MTLLDRYIARELATAFFFVMLALVPLFSFLDLIQQLDDVGSGNYGLLDAVLFELRMLAPRAIDLLPFGALMGSTIALVLLAQHGEVIAAQAAGIRVSRIVWAVMKSGILLMIATALLDELVMSPLHQEAVRQRSLQLSGTEVLQSDKGFWIHRDNTFLHIHSILHGRIPVDIDILELDTNRQVTTFIHAWQADISDPGNWLLKDLVLKKLSGETIISEHHPSMYWEPYLTSEQIGLLELPPLTMSPSQLYAYVQYIENSGQQTDRYKLAFWQKLVLPLQTGVMVLLAVPFAFGSPRSTSVGKRVMLALGGGILFQIITQVVANTGLILGFHPALTTLATPVATTVVALIFLSRIHA